MNLEKLKQELITLLDGHCELCNAPKANQVVLVHNLMGHPNDDYSLVCDLCLKTLKTLETLETLETSRLLPTHETIKNNEYWRCLSGAIWGERLTTKVLCFQILSPMKSLLWVQELLDQIHIPPFILQSIVPDQGQQGDQGGPKVLDSNGVILNEGDAVTLIKDLDVKGAGFVAKRGTLVKSIHLTNNTTQIEGKVNGTTIILLTKFLKKT
jgi:protein PhnA